MQNQSENEAPLLRPEDVEAALVESGALMEGHFLLTSGRHSARYVEKFRLLEQPRLTSRLCREIARRFAGDGIECVIGPVTGGIILAFETARHLGTRAVYAERSEGGEGFTFRRGFSLRPGERVLVVEDIVTTGGSVLQVLEAVRRFGGEPAGVALLVDRSNGSASFPVPRTEALLRLSIESWAPGEVPDWVEEKHGPALKPGSSKK